MAGLNLGIGGRVGGFAGVSPTSAPSYGSTASYAEVGAGVASGAFGPDVTTSAPRGMSPKNPVGMAFWIGVASVAALVIIRSTLPN